MTTSVISRLLTNKSAIGQTRIEAVDESCAVAAGEVVVRLVSFGLSANNITYAALGDWLKYWQFFPTGVDGWGQMPVWGFADVVASGTDGIEVGERFYGYFPIRSLFRMKADRISERGFYDGVFHSTALPTAYNFYTRCSADPGYAPELEDYQMLFRPLFITSYMLADFLVDNSYFGANRLLVSSASAKTAYGTAYCLKNIAGIEVIGLTSARNKAFVEELGCYDSVLSYDEMGAITAGVATTYVDFSGDEDLRRAVHDMLGPDLVYDCFAGTAAHDRPLDPGTLKGPAPIFFFAPIQIKKRNVDWTPQGLQERYGKAEQDFYQTVSNPAAPWMTLVHHQGM